MTDDTKETRQEVICNGLDEMTWIAEAEIIEQYTDGNMTDFKKAKNTGEAWDIQETYKGKPHGWIQWKGTSVCMDIHCKCGAHLHIDAEFAYHVKCMKCNTVYMCNGHIELIELEEDPEPRHCLVEAHDLINDYRLALDVSLEGKPMSPQVAKVADALAKFLDEEGDDDE